MPPQVKVCGLTREKDIETALALGADYIGLNVWPGGPRGLSADRLEELLPLVPEGRRVMVDVETGTEELERWRDRFGFDYYQIHFRLDVSMATVAAWGGFVTPDSLWLAPRLPPGEDFPQMALNFAETVLIDAYAPDKPGGTGKTASWDRFAELQLLYQHKHWILAGGLGPDNIADAVAASGAEIVDVNSGVESAPGIKDPGKLKALFEALRA